MFIIGAYGLRFLRRRGWHNLMDVEILLQTDGEVTNVAVTVDGKTEPGKRLIDRSEVERLWAELCASPEDTAPIAQIGKLLFDGLVS